MAPDFDNSYDLPAKPMKQALPATSLEPKEIGGMDSDEKDALWKSNTLRILRAAFKGIVGQSPKDLEPVLFAKSLMEGEKLVQKAYPLIPLNRSELGKIRSELIKAGIPRWGDNPDDPLESMAEMPPPELQYDDGKCAGHRCKNRAGPDRRFCQTHDAFERNHKAFRDAVKKAMPGEVMSPQRLQKETLRQILEGILKQFGTFNVSPQTLDGFMAQLPESITPDSLASVIAQDPSKLGLHESDVPRVMEGLAGGLVRKGTYPGYDAAKTALVDVKPVSGDKLNMQRLLSESQAASDEPMFGADSGWQEDVEHGLVTPGTPSARPTPLVEKAGDTSDSLKDIKEAHRKMMAALNDNNMEGVSDEAELIAHHAEDIQDQDQDE